MKSPEENEEDLLNAIQNLPYLPASVYEASMGIKTLKRDGFLHDEGELETICDLIEVHSPALRNQATICFDQVLEAQTGNASVNRCRDLIAMKCPTADSATSQVKMLLEKLEEMPEEWTVVQLTPRLTTESFFNVDDNFYVTSPIHLTVFRCGKGQCQPFTVTIDVPKDPVTDDKIELLNEMVSIINSHKEILSSVHKQVRFRNYKQKVEYVEERQSIECRLKRVIQDVQEVWLKAWKCLLLGKCVEENLEDLILTEVKNYFSTKLPDVKLNEKTKMLVYSLVKGSMYLKLSEVKSAILDCFPDVSDKNLIKNIVRGVRSLGEKFLETNDTLTRHPVILIVHESLDCFPWEQLDVLQNQPVSRLPSFHFLYYLFKEYEDEIQDGYKVITDHTCGTYIINPGTDLKKMEIRLMSFFNYWVPNWTGIFGYKPEKDEFYELLVSSRIFSYNGHGSGSHYLSLDKIQQSKVKSVVLLFGCESVKVKRENAQVHVYSSHYAYLIARCPCVVGMLWVVTDTDTDVLTADFLSYWIPSQAETHWKHIDKTKWKAAQPELNFCKSAIIREQNEVLSEPKLSSALNLAKKKMETLTTKAACVVRGLPVKIV